MTNTRGAYVVAWDFTRGNDVGVLIVGRQEKGKMDIVNAFQGQEAMDIYEKLTDKKEEQHANNRSKETASDQI